MSQVCHNPKRLFQGLRMKLRRYPILRRVDSSRRFLYDEQRIGWALSSAVRAFGLHPKGRPFKSDSAHHCDASTLSGDVVQLVRTLPSRWLESYTVTVDSFDPALFGGFLILLAVHSHILRCIRADLTAVFTIATVQQTPRFTAWCSESATYCRMRCPDSVQNILVWDHLYNNCATTL
jgi:hypothetical protein